MSEFIFDDISDKDDSDIEETLIEDEEDEEDEDDEKEDDTEEELDNDLDDLDNLDDETDKTLKNKLNKSNYMYLYLPEKVVLIKERVKQIANGYKTNIPIEILKEKNLTDSIDIAMYELYNGYFPKNTYIEREMPNAPNIKINLKNMIIN